MSLKMMIAYFFTGLCFLVSALLFYRGSLREHQLTSIIGQIIKKQFVCVNYKSKSYALILQLNNQQEVGVYLGTESQAQKSDLNQELRVGETYQFLIDPTVSGSLGVRKISSTTKLVYEEHMAFNYIGGAFMLLFGMIVLVVIRKEKKRLI